MLRSQLTETDEDSINKNHKTVMLSTNLPISR